VTPSTSRYSSRIKIESPHATAATKKATAAAGEDLSTDGESSSKSDEATLADKPKAKQAFKSDEVVQSPTKSKL